MKKCKKCNELKSLDEFYTVRRKTGYTYKHSYCKICHNGNNKKRKEYFKNYLQEYVEKNSEEINAKKRNYNKKTREHRLNSDWYIKRSLYQRSELTKEDITPEMIEIQRKCLKLGRDLLKIKNKRND